MKINRFAKFAWIVLAYNILVVLYGAFVRATGSGAGCGSHWPTCNGEIIPRPQQIETLIEFGHRLTSGLALILVVALFIWAFRQYPKGHTVRLGASLSLLFIITEALVGAGLVLFEWVADNDSVERVISMSVHLINTFILLAMIALTAYWASGGQPLRLKGQGLALWGLGLGILMVIVLGVTGAITALGDTLFPAGSLAEGIRQDFSPTAHFLERLRVYHPIVAIITGMYLIFTSLLVAMFRQEKPQLKRFVAVFSALFVTQLIAGMVNVLLLAPVWMQIIHLLLADLVWLTLILMTAVAFGDETPQTVEAGQPVLSQVH